MTNLSIKSAGKTFAPVVEAGVADFSGTTIDGNAANYLSIGQMIAGRVDTFAYQGAAKFATAVKLTPGRWQASVSPSVGKTDHVAFEVREPEKPQPFVVRHAGAVLPWKEPDWTPAEKAALLRAAGRSMHGRWWGGFDREVNQAHADAGILPVIMFNARTASEAPSAYAARIHAACPDGTIIALGNEIGHGDYWQGGSFSNACIYYAAVADELKRLGRKDIAAPCRNYSTLAGAQADVATIRAADKGRSFTWLNLHWYTDGTQGNLATAAAVFAFYRQACDQMGMKLLADEWGLLANAVNASDGGLKAFTALCKIVVPTCDVSCVWLLAPSKGQTAVAVVGVDGGDTIYSTAWRAA